jgi:hypothetical protein
VLDVLDVLCYVSSNIAQCCVVKTINCLLTFKPVTVYLYLLFPINKAPIELTLKGGSSVCVPTEMPLLAGMSPLPCPCAQYANPSHHQQHVGDFPTGDKGAPAGNVLVSGGAASSTCKLPVWPTPGRCDVGSCAAIAATFSARQKEKGNKRKRESRLDSSRASRIEDMDKVFIRVCRSLDSRRLNRPDSSISLPR